MMRTKLTVMLVLAASVCASAPLPPPPKGAVKHPRLISPKEASLQAKVPAPKVVMPPSPPGMPAPAAQFAVNTTPMAVLTLANDGLTLVAANIVPALCFTVANPSQELYTVSWSTNLTKWQVLFSGGTESPIIFYDLSHLNGPPLFYKVEVDQ